MGTSKPQRWLESGHTQGPCLFLSAPLPSGELSSPTVTPISSPTLSLAPSAEDYGASQFRAPVPGSSSWLPLSLSGVSLLGWHSTPPPPSGTLFTQRRLACVPITTVLVLLSMAASPRGTVLGGGRRGAAGLGSPLPPAPLHSHSRDPSTPPCLCKEEGLSHLPVPQKPSVIEG